MDKKRQIFGEPNDNDEGNPTIAYLGGITQRAYTFWDLAEAFKITGDILVDQVIGRKFEAHELVYPVLYNYRHSLELYLKHFVYKSEADNIHPLHALLEKFEKYIVSRHGTKVPNEFRKLILEIHDFDNNEETFRYPELVKSNSKGDMGEFRISFPDIRKKMDEYQEIFHKVMLADADSKKG